LASDQGSIVDRCTQTPVYSGYEWCHIFDPTFDFMSRPSLKNGTGGILHSGLSICELVSECVSLCVPKTLWTPYLTNQWREFRPILVTYVFWFVVLSSFSDQRSKVKVTEGSEPETWWILYLRNYWS